MKSIVKNAVAAGLFLFATLGLANAQTTESVTIKGSKGNLSAIVQKPKMKDGDKVRVAILCHGFTSSKEYKLLRDIADSLQQRGIASIRFDFNGHGASEGKLEEMTVVNELEDARRVIAYTLQQSWAKDVSLVGHSQGGVVASMLSGELNSGIRCAVLCAPASVLREDAIRGVLMDAMYDAGNLPEYVTIYKGKLRIGKAYLESAQTLPIYETASRYDGPMLIVHGTADRIVPYTYGERYKRECKNAELVLLPGGDHMFMKPQEYTRVAGMVADFIAKH